jgi:ParB-like chromosome segregation protein Spo0J
MSNVENLKPSAPASELPPNPEGLPVTWFADSYPMGNPYELEAMAESIAKQGILVPIEIWRDEAGKWWKIDGRNRVKAAQAARYRFKSTDFKVFVGSESEAVARAEALNSHRRHLTKEQKEERVRMLIAKYPHLPSRKLALMCGVSHTTVANIRREGHEEDTTYKTLEKAWVAASVQAQEEFARTFRVDLTELLRA